MALGTRLSDLVSMSAIEAQITSQASLTPDITAQFKQWCAAVQEDLLIDYDWPHLNETEDETSRFFQFDTFAGQRFYDWPADVDPDTVTEMAHKWGGVWTPMIGEGGITPDDYTAFDSEEDVRTDPPMKWARKSKDQFEIWPVPATSGTPITITARRAIARLTADTDRCIVDDWAIVYFAASRYHEGKEGHEQQQRMSYARGMKRLVALKTRAKAGTRPALNFADRSGRPYPKDPRFRLLVAR